MTSVVGTTTARDDLIAPTVESLFLLGRVRFVLRGNDGRLIYR
jgi:hypothetical protein